MLNISREKYPIVIVLKHTKVLDIVLNFVLTREFALSGIILRRKNSQAYIHSKSFLFLYNFQLLSSHPQVYIHWRVFSLSSRITLKSLWKCQTYDNSTHNINHIYILCDTSASMYTFIDRNFIFLQELHCTCTFIRSEKIHLFMAN